MKTHYGLLTAGALLAMLVAVSSCGGGGGGGTAATTPETLAGTENSQVDEVVSQSVAYTDAVDEYVNAYETATSGIDLEQMSGQEAAEYLFDQLGEENTSTLANQLNSISDEKMLPSLSAALEAHSDMLLSEEQLSQMLSGTTQSSLLRSTDLSINETFQSPYDARGFLTVPVCVGGAVILIGAASVGLSCWDRISTEQKNCMTQWVSYYEARNHPTPKAIATLICAESFMGAMPECLQDLAVSHYTNLLSAGAAGYKTIQFLIDGGSGVDAGIKVHKVIGKRGCDTNPSPAPPSMLFSGSREALELDPDATALIGHGEDSKFLVPDGEWTFLTFADGYARQVSGCVDTTENEGTTQHQLSMTPVDELESGMCMVDDTPSSSTLDLVISIPGYTGPFEPALSYAGLASQDNGPKIYPSITAFSSLDVTQSDNFLMILNNTLPGTGTYSVSETMIDEGGTAGIYFSTLDITHEDNGDAVAFYAISGTLTLEQYGLAQGERLKGNFSVTVEGKQDICVDPECDDTVDNTITGTITGVFDDVILF